MWITKTRAQNAQVAQDNTHLLNKNCMLMDLVQQSYQLSTIYDSAQLYPKHFTNPTTKANCKISVVNDSSLNAALLFDKATILNFASAVRPGGGYLDGSNAQEECLCRASGLYEVISRFNYFYEDNIRFNSNLYLDTLIYSPNVPFFRDDYGHLMMDATIEPRLFDVITAAMPNLNPNSHEARHVNFVAYPAHLLEQTYRRKIELVLASASIHKTKNLILGAWGCGVFRNDPDTVSRIFAEYLKYDYGFENVVFAILDKKECTLIKAFEKNLINE